MNPFKYGTIVTDKQFINRKKELLQLASDTLNGNNVIIYAPRRYGKTSLIIELIKNLKKKGIKIVYLDFFQVFDQENFIQLYASKIMEAAGFSIKKILNSLRKYIRGIVPTITIAENGNPVLSFSYQTEVPKEYSLLDVLDLPEKLKKKGERWVIVFDEFQEINRLNGEIFEKQFRSVLQFHDEIIYIFMGSKTHLMLNMFTDKRRAFYNIGKIFKLDKISPDEMKEYIKREFNKGGFSFQENIFEKILYFTNNIPYYNQFLASQIWQLAKEEGKKINESIINDAVEMILDNQSDYYFTLFDKLTNYQRKVLYALLYVQENIYSKEHSKKFGLSSVSSTQRVINVLINSGIVVEINRRYEFSDPFFPLYLKLRIFA